MVLQLVRIFGVIDDQVISKVSALVTGSEAGDKSGSGKNCDDGIQPAPGTEIQQKIDVLCANFFDCLTRVEDRELHNNIRSLQ